MILEKIMSKNIITIGLDDTLSKVREIFSNTKFHHLLVVESGKLFGVASDRDLLKALGASVGTAAETAKDAATLNKKVHQIMTRKPITLKASADIYDAVSIFNQHTVSCIPIVDDENRPVGIISWRDILRVIEASRKKTP
ncbi:MAG: CBS domain-containing protein [Gammaproteobacteria bacterium]|nr:CBS domain-containing protein [Gammaproteobacteria bacterium]